MIPENWAEKPPPPAPQDEGKNFDFRSLVFVAHITQVEYPRSPYYKSILRFILSKYLVYVTTFVNFSKYSHIQNYRTQDHGAYGRSIGSPTTIHTNIPAITVTLLAIELGSVIRILSL